MTTRTVEATIQATASTAQRPSARAMVGRLLRAGCTPLEAGNLSALAVGLGPVASGWSILEIERLRFLQHLDGTGRLPA